MFGRSICAPLFNIKMTKRRRNVPVQNVSSAACRKECLTPVWRVNVTHFSPPFCDGKQIRMKRRHARVADHFPDPDHQVFSCTNEELREGGVKTVVDAADTRGEEQLCRSVTWTEGFSERHCLRRAKEEEQQRPTCPPTGLAAGTTTISPLADRPLSHLLRITLRIYKSSPSLRCKRDSKWHWCPAGRDGDGKGTDMKGGSGGCLEAKPYSWWVRAGSAHLSLPHKSPPQTKET